MHGLSKLLTAILVSLCLILLSACGGSSGGSESASVQTGRVSVIVTDGPTDDFERILITLSRMTLIGSGGQQVIYDGAPVTFDLLQLRDRADLAFSERVVAGDYNKIRLEVTEVRLIDLGDPADPGDDVEVVLDRLPANGKIDLNPRGSFSVAADRPTVVELDIDARRSFQVVQTGNGRLKLRPVIFVNVYDDDIALPTRITRVFGTVTEVDTDNSMLVLCDLEFVARLGDGPNPDMDACVRVFADGANHFDDAGLPFDFAALAAAIGAADTPRLTAVGLPSFPDTSAPADTVLDLDAVVTEFGPRKTNADTGWETTAGTVVSDPSADGCAADSCVDFQPAEEADPLPVQLRPETRVFTADGVEIGQADIGTGRKGAFDGLRVDEAGIEELRAALFIAGPAVEDGAISGTLTAVSIGDEFDVLTVQPEGAAAVSACVTGDTDLLRILTDDETTTIADLLDPAALDPSEGLQVEVSGDPGADPACDIDASLVIVD
ncbi:MAG: DUF4382 domain-containing protein [Gammaproteobacteria bacterium]